MSDLRDLERARGILHYPRGYLTHREAKLLTQFATEFAAIRAEAKAEGWVEAIQLLYDWGNPSGAEMLAANRPSPTGRES